MDILAIFRRRLSSHKPITRSRKLLIVEELEDRCLLSVYTPAQITHAYGFDQILFGSVKGDGTGQTIAIVDAYDAPKIDADLQKFDGQFGISNNDGLGNYVLSVAYAQGTKPAYSSGWSQEIALDVEWAHAVAPGAHILLVEAASNSYADLFGAVDFARSYPGVSVVSMSWGSSEFSSESTYDYHMTTPAGHNGVSFVASSGDTGAVISYPAVSPNVLGVGGTSVQISSGGTWLSETVWSGSGGGVSSYESKPNYQSSVTQSSTKRTSPDVAYDADPNTGVYVYWTNASTNAGGWYSFGGTSAGAPQWAGLVAIANQGRTYNTDTALQGSLDGRSQLLPAIYNLPAADFHDETSGKAGVGRRANSATVGYDLATGRGSPLAELVVQHLVTATSTGAVGTSGSGSGSGGGGGGPVFIVLSSVDAPSESSSSTDVFQSRNPTKTGSTLLVAAAAPTTRAGETSTSSTSESGQAAQRAATDSAATVPLWMTLGSGAAGVDDDGDEMDGAGDMPLADGNLALVVSRRQAQDSTIAHQAPSAAECATPRAVINVNAPTPNGAAADPMPAREPAAPTPAGFVTKTLSNALWLAGAVAFLAQGAYFGRHAKEQQNQERRKRELSEI